MSTPKPSALTLAQRYDHLDFATLQARHNGKWHHYGPDVLPMWVADMDFPTSDAIIETLIRTAQGNNLVYPHADGIQGLTEAICAWQANCFNWHITPDHLWLIHGIIPSMFAACMTCCSAGDEVIMTTPIYPPFMMSVNNTQRTLKSVPLVWAGSRWEMDFEALEAAITPRTRLLMLCNPHNPTGRVFDRAELEKLAAFALKHNLWVLSDELHNEFCYEKPHIPFASLGPEIAQRTITILGPTKAFNIPALKMGILITENAALMQALQDATYGLLMAPNVMVQHAALCAYTNPEAKAWLDQTMDYLRQNRQLVSDTLASRLPSIRYATPEATYLAWFDLSHLKLGDKTLETVLVDEGKLGLNLGEAYGLGGEGFARLNFATSQVLVKEGLERLEHAITPYLP